MVRQLSPTHFSGLEHRPYTRRFFRSRGTATAVCGCVARLASGPQALQLLFFPLQRTGEENGLEIGYV
jgi:hypothetical protein